MMKNDGKRKDEWWNKSHKEERQGGRGVDKCRFEKCQMTTGRLLESCKQDASLCEGGSTFGTQ